MNTFKNFRFLLILAYVLVVLGSCVKPKDVTPEFEPFKDDLAVGSFQAEVDGKSFIAEPNGGLSIYYGLGGVNIMVQNRQSDGFWVWFDENKVVLNRTYSLKDDFSIAYHPVLKGNIAQQFAALGGFRSESGTIKFTKMQKGKSYEGEFEFVGVNENFKQKYTVKNGRFNMAFK
ncbi:MAG: hypothetical protein ACK4GN_13980 [Runella sp.]